MEQEIYKTLVEVVKNERIDKEYFKGILKASKMVILDEYGLGEGSKFAAMLFHGPDGEHLDAKYVRKYTKKVVEKFNNNQEKNILEQKDQEKNKDTYTVK